MSKLEAGCKAFIINDPFVPENNWKVVELLYLCHSDYDVEHKEDYVITENGNDYTVPGEGYYWVVEGDLLSEDNETKKLFADTERCYKPENLMPLKGDFKLEQQTTENSLSCLSN